MTKVKRILAFIIDFVLIMIPVAVAIWSYITFVLKNPEANTAIGFAFFGLCFIVIISFIILVCRDAFIGRRSLGKFLFGLRVIDSKDCCIASKKQRIGKNLLVFLFPLDALFLIMFNKSLGNLFSGTLVVSNIEF